MGFGKENFKCEFCYLDHEVSLYLSFANYQILLSQLVLIKIVNVLKNCSFESYKAFL